MTLKVTSRSGFGAHRSAAAAWTPAQLPGLSFWYDPSSLSSLDQSSGGGTPVTANNDPVGLMNDLSGNGHHLSQATSGSRPLWKTSGGLSWLEFDGSDDALFRSEANVPIGTAIAGAYVGSAGPVYSAVLTNTVDGAVDVDYIFVDGGYGAPPALGQWDNTNQGSSGAGLCDSTHIWNNKVQTPLITLDAVRVYSCDGTNYPSTMQFPNGIKIGYDRSNPGRVLLGRIYGIIVTTGILSGTDRALAETWMGERCGLVI